MRASIATLVVAATAVTAQTQPAPVISNNAAGTQYVATLPEKASTTLRGSVQIGAASSGTGVDVAVSLSGLPATGGPFIYHIHAAPVPADGNCTGALAHQDPYLRGEMPLCDAAAPQTCQLGDLSGKHGNITTSSSFSAKYSDLYLSTTPGDVAFFGNLSVVVHFSNKTRISCANFSRAAVSTSTVSSGFAQPTGSVGINATSSAVTTVNVPTAPPKPSSTLPTTNAAGRVAAGAGAVLAFAAVLLL